MTTTRHTTTSRLRSASTSTTTIRTRSRRTCSSSTSRHCARARASSALSTITRHTRSSKTKVIEPSHVIIVEGILIFQDERLRDLFDIKIFVEADADERILRRVLRDMNERGRDLENIISQYLTTVKPMHYLYVEPTKNLADIVINSGLNDVAFDIMKTKIQDILANAES